MIKKFGVVTVGVAAGLLTAAPLASGSDHDDHHDPVTAGGPTTDELGL